MLEKVVAGEGCCWRRLLLEKVVAGEGCCWRRLLLEKVVAGEGCQALALPAFLHQAVAAAGIPQNLSGWLMACLQKWPSLWPMAHKGNLESARAWALVIWLPPKLARGLIMSTTL